MAPSGTSSFDLNLAQIIEDAYDLCGLTVRGGSDYRAGRRCMDMLLIDWSNRGTNFWKLEEASTAVAAGTQDVVLDADVLDVIEIYVRTGAGVNQTDLSLERIDVAEWARRPNKLTTGRPVNVWVEKLRTGPTLHLWPVPDQAYTVVYHQLVRMQDAGSPATNTSDVPWRFLPALTAGLAVEIAKRRAPDRLPFLKPSYEELWLNAVASDRDRSALRLRPGVSAYRR